MNKDLETNLRFELDVRSLQRALVPWAALKVLSQASEGMVGLRIKDAVVELLERTYPTEELEKSVSSKALKSRSFELHVSVLYPMLEYMKGRGWISREEASPYAITKEGKRTLALWNSWINRLGSKAKNETSK